MRLKLRRLHAVHSLYTCITFSFTVDVACANPPFPNASLNLNLTNWVEGQVYAFGDSAVYACNAGHYFEEDMYMDQFNLTCNPDGSWTSPLPWRQCIHPQQKYCDDPPRLTTTFFIYTCFGHPRK